MDDDLKREFAALRAHERLHTLSFDAVLANAPAERRRTRKRWPIAVAAAAAFATVLLWPRHISNDAETLTITTWRAPTDALLDTPGMDLLSELPALNESILNVGGTP